MIETKDTAVKLPRVDCQQCKEPFSYGGTLNGLCLRCTANALEAEKKKFTEVAGILREAHKTIEQARPREIEMAQCILDHAEEHVKLRAQLESAQRREAAMRDALVVLRKWLDCGCTKESFIYACSACRMKREVIDPALTHLTHSPYIHRDKLKPIVKALLSTFTIGTQCGHFHNGLYCPRCGKRDEHAPSCQIGAALALARELGLTEEAK